ncbi:B3 domain-containing protein [Actinidia chinensis var. chinensis]|uniref:B3 domain-containing protein n=1 Tax=Actinidia chinensis var. chinensis TaxID=1590841 RepID=A0A2R6PPE2_ACTCC|nr:B3 domain-containing protein [Actinidia chinensis var. chinensis]
MDPKRFTGTEKKEQLKETKFDSNVSGEGEPSFSTPTDPATEKENSDLMEDPKSGNSPPGQILPEQLLISLIGDEVREWEMTLKYSCAEGAFMITNGWEKFVQDNMLQGGNTIQFYKPNRRRRNNHYNIRCIRGEEFGNAATCHQGEGYLFQHPLTLDDVSSNRLIIPTEYATSYFFGFESMDEHVSGEGQHPTTETESSNKINVSGDDSRSRNLRETPEFSTESESSVNMNVSQDSKIGSQTENSGFATETEEEEEEEEEPGNSSSETEDENWPIQKRLTPTDVEEYLFLPFRSLSAYPDYFPRLSEPKDLLIIDSRNQFWSMKVVFDQERDGYVVTGMWKEFVNKHKLKATQKIKLNIPYFGLGSESSTYFNIVCMRKEGDSVTDLSSMGSEENEGNSDDQSDDLDGNSDEQGDDEEGNSGKQGDDEGNSGDDEEDDEEGNSGQQGDDEGNPGDDEEGNLGEQGDDEGDSDDDDGGFSSQGSIN